MLNESCINLQLKTQLHSSDFCAKLQLYRKLNIFARSRPWRVLNATSCKKSQKKKIAGRISTLHDSLTCASASYRSFLSVVRSPLHVAWSIAPSAGTNFLGSLLVARRFNPAGRRVLGEANTPSIRDSR